MKKCSPFLAIKEIKIKTILKFPPPAIVRMSVIKNTNSKCWHGWGDKEPSYTVGGNVNYRATLENSMVAHQKMNNRTAIWSSNTTSRYIPKICMSRYNKDTCTPIFIVALFTISKLWKHLRCPTTDKQIKTRWNIYNLYI
jgi:hypothetical protein